MPLLSTEFRAFSQPSEQRLTVFDRSAHRVTSRIVVMGNHRLIVLIDIPVNVTLMENAAYFHKAESPVVELVLPEPNSTLSGTQPLTGRRSPLRPAVSPLIWTAMWCSNQVVLAFGVSGFNP